jgi:putative NADPH-quinone reductase
MGSDAMPKRVLVIEGHPDLAGKHLCNALADAYAQGAAEGGHAVQRIAVAELEFPWLHTKEDFEQGVVPPAILSCQQAIRDADHLVIVHPVWLGDMPAVLKAFCEQVFRPGFAFQYAGRGFPVKRMKGKSARIVVTLGMPSLIYRWYFGAHGLKNSKRSILGFCGFAPVRHNLFGMVEGASEAKRRRWLTQMQILGRAAA